MQSWVHRCVQPWVHRCVQPWVQSWYIALYNLGYIPGHIAVYSPVFSFGHSTVSPDTSITMYNPGYIAVYRPGTALQGRKAGVGRRSHITLMGFELTTF